MKSTARQRTYAKPVEAKVPSEHKPPKAAGKQDAARDVEIPFADDNLLVQAMLAQGLLQPKLAITPPDDPSEREADDVADALVQRKEACSCGGTCASCREEEALTVQRKGRDARRDSQMSASPRLMSRLGPGRGLDPTTRGFFESNLHHDFSRTRIHADARAHESASSINARAFTHGDDVVFARGQYAPETTEGRTLIAHELAHVVQQRQHSTEPPIQRQPNEGGAMSLLPYEHQNQLDAIAKAWQAVELERGELQSTQSKIDALPAVSDETVDARREALTAELKELKQRINMLLGEHLELVENAITALRAVLPGEDAEYSPSAESVQAVQMEILRLQQEVLPYKRVLARKEIEEINAQLAGTSVKLPMSLSEFDRQELELRKHSLSEFLSGTAQNRAAPGSHGRLADRRCYAVYQHEVRAAGELGWRFHNRGSLGMGPSVKKVPSGVMAHVPPTNDCVGKVGLYIFSSDDASKDAVKDDLDRQADKGIGAGSFLLAFSHEGQKYLDDIKKQCPGLDVGTAKTVNEANENDKGVNLSALKKGNPDLYRCLKSAIFRVETGSVKAGDTITCGHTEEAADARALLGCDDDTVQPKLNAPQDDDPLEREADEVADALVQRKEACSCGGTCASCREEEALNVQRKARDARRDSQMSASPRLMSRLGPGRGLDPTTRGFFESNLHHDFSRTRVHTDSAAAESAASIDSRAFTHGRDVVFGRGEYAPHTTEGRRLLAHELTHVVQQDPANGRGGIQRQLLAEAVGGGSTNDRFVVLGPFDAGDIHLDGGEIVIETADSLPPIRTVTLPPPYLHAGEPFSIPDSMVRLESEAEETPEPEPLPPPTGEHANQQVGTWGRFLEIALMTGAVHAQSFATQEEAITFARSLGSAAAVFQEGEIFAVYPVHEDSTLYDLEYGDVRIGLGTNLTDIIAVGPVLAIITEDGNTIVPPHGGGDTWMKMRESLPEGAEADPYALHTQVFGEGLNQITDRDQFLRVFEMAMRDTTLVILDQSKAEAERQRTALSGGIPEEDVETIARVTDALVRIDQAKSQLAMVIRNNDYAMIAAGRGHRLDEVRRLQEANDQKRRDIGELDSFRKIILLDYPLLSHIEDIEDFSESSRAERGTTLYDTTNEVLRNIVTTRGNVLSGSLNLWAIEPVVQATLAGLIVTGETQRGWALGKASSERAWDMAIQIALAVLQIGFSIAAFAVSGPVGAAFTVAALGVGLTDAIMMTDRYLENVAAAGTDINVEEALVPADLGGEWVWVVLAWVGVGLDMADAVRAVRAIRAGTATLEETIPRLAREADLDEAALRRAATHTADEETVRVLERTSGSGPLSPSDLDTELRHVHQQRPIPIADGEYDAMVDLGNGHTWRRRRGSNTWCRHSNGSFCVLMGEGPETSFVHETTRHRAGISDAETRAAREELEGNMGAPPSAGGGWQRHHIIPLELRNHPLIEEISRRFGWNINGGGNGIYLPTSRDIPGGEVGAIHLGPHGAYTSWIESRLDLLHQRYRYELIEDTEILGAVEALVLEFGARLDNRSIRLRSTTEF